MFHACKMSAAIQYAGRMGARYSIKQAFDKFMSAPYGYVEEDVKFLIASLYKKEKISLKMNSVPSESNALLQNLLAEIGREEAAYQQSIQQKAAARAGEEPPVAPATERNVIHTLPVTMRSLTGNRTYTFRTEAEIDDFVEEIRENLKSKLGGDTVIKLS